MTGKLGFKRDSMNIRDTPQKASEEYTRLEVELEGSAHMAWGVAAGMLHTIVVCVT